ncbi:MAG: hypothetical protein ACLFTK_12130 [Anaerolineales bacterium]
MVSIQLALQNGRFALIKGIERDAFQVYVGRDANMMNMLYRLSPKRATRFMYNQMKALRAVS